MDTNSLMELLNNTSGILGILGGVLNSTHKVIDLKLEKQLEKIDILEHKKICNLLIDDINIETIDKILAENATVYKDKTVLYSLKEKTKNNLLTQIYASDNIFIENKNNIDKIIYEYVEALFTNIGKRLSFGEKCLLNESNTINNKLDSLNDLVQSQSQDKQITKQANQMVDMLNQLMEYINLKQEIIKSNIIGKIDIFTSSEPNPFFKNFNYLIVSFEYEEKYFEKEVSNVWEFFLKYVKSLDSTQNLELEEYYYKVILPTISCYTNYNSKNSDFYCAVGAIGLFQNYTDETLVERVVVNIISYISKLLKFLRDYNSEHNSQLIEEIVYSRFIIQKEAYVMKMLTPESEKLLYEIYSSKEILDTELSLKYNFSIDYLRKKLSPFIETVVYYKYYDKFSTTLMISPGYKETISSLLRKRGVTNEV